MSGLRKEMWRLMGMGLDISEHLGLLHGLACDPGVTSVVEIGFRDGVSATALAAAGKTLHCIDILPCTNGVKKLRGLGAKFTFQCADSLMVKIPDCDMLHIDGLHTHDQLYAELVMHAPKVRKWIAMHDTTKFAAIDQRGAQPGLVSAIMNFLKKNEEWSWLLRLHNNNGLSIIQRA